MNEGNYSLVKIIILAILCIFMSLTIGGSSLLSQQMLINLCSLFSDSDENESEFNNDEANVIINDEIIMNDNEMKIEYEEDENKEDNNLIENNELIKKQNSISNKEKTRIKNINAFFIVSFTTVLGAMEKNLMYYQIFDYNNSNHTEKNETKNDTIINQTNFSYFLQNNISDENEFYISDKKTLLLYVYATYIICILFSIILYRFFTCIMFIKKEKKHKNKNTGKCCVWKSFFQIFNCIFYIESTDVENKNKIGNCKLCGETFKNYCDNCYCSCFCCKYNKDDYDKDSQLFCFCYQEKGYCDWIDKFLANDIQKELLPCMILYFISKLKTIGYEKEMKNINENEGFNLLEKMEFTIYLIIAPFVLDCLRGKEDLINNKLSKIMIKEFIYLLLISSISEIVIFALDKKIGFRNLYHIFIINKLFLFSLNYFCLNLAKNNERNEFLLSQSTLITIYLSIIEGIINLINYLIGENLDLIYNIQIKLSYILVACSLCFFIRIISNKCCS